MTYLWFMNIKGFRWKREQAAMIQYAVNDNYRVEYFQKYSNLHFLHLVL